MQCRNCGGTEPVNPDECNTNTLFLGSLPLDVTEEQIRRMFHAYGVSEVTLKGPNKGRKKSSAKVEMESIDVARDAWRNKEQHYIYDNQESIYVVVKPYYSARK